MAFQNHPSVLPFAPGQFLAPGLVACFATSVTAFALEQALTTLGPTVFWNQMPYVGGAMPTAFLLGYVSVYVGYTGTQMTADPRTGRGSQ